MVLASSKDNFMTLSNSHSTSAPYVTFTVGSPTNVTITIKDANNDDGYNKVITGSSTSVISSDSFNTGGIAVLNLMECLKMNSIFFNIILESANTIKCSIDTAIKYSITVSGSGVSVGGTYSSYNAQSPNKMVLMMQGSVNGKTTNITMEKFNNDATISFNVTSPFSYQTLKYPVQVNLTAYQVYNNQSSLVTVPYSSAIIMPTTLHKFQSVDYGEYYGSGKKKFLTNNFVRSYNYDEDYSLSMLTDASGLTLKKSYYTNSGVFLTSETGHSYSERNVIRTDFYDRLDLSGVEARFGRQVGYVNVVAINGSTEVSEPVRFNVNPFCQSNNVIFFVNEIGGIDSYNFGGVSEVKLQIDDISSYFSNPVRDFTDTYEIEAVNQKTNEIQYTLSTKMIDRQTALWLNELGKSKWAFKYLGLDLPRFKTILVDKLDISIASNEDEFEIELEYHDSDNRLTI